MSCKASTALMMSEFTVRGSVLLQHYVGTGGASSMSHARAIYTNTIVVAKYSILSKSISVVVLYTLFLS
jgi:hypothetical protein